MKMLFILNDPPYGTERSFNAVRLVQALLKRDPEPEITIFLMADAVVCAKDGQSVPSGYYNLGHMIKAAGRKADVVLCGTCMDARGLGDDELVEGAVRGTMPGLAELTTEADKVLVF